MSKQGTNTFAQYKNYYKEYVVLAAHAAKLIAIKNLNIKHYSTVLYLPYQQLLRAYQGSKTQSNQPVPDNARRLNPNLDLALCQYLDALDAISYGIHRGLVHTQATALLHKAYISVDKAPPLLSKN
jgi:hypothetical protein